jgi:hypothetical protein
MALTRLRRPCGSFHIWPWMILLATCLAIPSPAYAQASVVGGVFGTPFEDRVLQSDWGVKAIATASRGTGGEFRWARSEDEDIWSAGLFQTVPAVRGAKTLQPFASLGVFRVSNASEHATGLSVAGGVAAFIGHLGFDADFRYLLGFDRFAGEKIHDRHVSFGLLWRF